MPGTAAKQRGSARKARGRTNMCRGTAAEKGNVEGCLPSSSQPEATPLDTSAQCRGQQPSSGLLREKRGDEQVCVEGRRQKRGTLRAVCPQAPNQRLRLWTPARNAGDSSQAAGFCEAQKASRGVCIGGSPERKALRRTGNMVARGVFQNNRSRENKFSRRRLILKNSNLPP